MIAESEAQAAIGFAYTGVQFRHSGWRKDRTRIFAALRRTGQTMNRCTDFKYCGRHAYVFQSVDDPDEYTVGGSTCHDRFCVPCARERSRRIATNVCDYLEKEQARFLTLTLRSTDEPLADLLAKLTKDFAALRRTKLWKNKVTGGVAFMEVKWFPVTNRWHPHLHCLVQGRYLPRDELSNLWLKITGTSKILDIRFAKNNSYVTHYITKYATKAFDHSVLLDPNRLDEAILALKGKRLCLTFGTWRGFSLTTDLEEGKWINLGLLEEVIRLATEGSQTMIDALEILKIQFDPPARSPPELDVPTRPLLTFGQLDLPDLQLTATTWE